MEGKAVGRVDFDLYLITDRHQTGGRALEEVLQQACRAGVEAIQLREKDMAAVDLLKLARGLKASLKGVRIFINDRVDVAVAASADGVHLGQKGLPPDLVKRSFGWLTIGVSTHSLDEALQAQARGADFVTFGPVFHTPSKASYGPPLGLERLREVAERLEIPVFAIGGVNRENIRDVISAGAYGIALISAIMASPQVERSASEIISELKRAKGAVALEPPEKPTRF